MLARYEISCTKCGVIDWTSNKTTAILRCRWALDRHNEAGERVELYDKMAHRGSEELWEAREDGLHVLRRRPLGG